MRSPHVLLSFVILGALSLAPVHSQSVSPQADVRAVVPTPIIGILRDSNTRVAPPLALQSLHAEATATFVVNYTGFTPQAQAAFQAAVDVWANLITSPVPIVVNAQFAALSPSVLGSAAATYVVKDFPGAPQSQTWYPAAVANARAGSDLFLTESDIRANFSSAVPNWYFGTDGNTPSGQFDFMTVVLHELGHGLGFSGSAIVVNGVGQWGAGDPGAIFPFSYDRAIVNAASQSIVDTTLFSNPSAALASQYTSGSLFWSGPAATAANGGVRPRLYAPATWAQGSSYSHLNEATYPAGSANSLMTPFIGTAESIHSPGPITLGILADVGWAVNAPPPCSFTVTPTNTGAPTGGVVGAAVTVTTAPGCAWVAASNSPAFLTITSGHSATGSGVVTYNVAPNGASFRIGTLTVAGQQVSIAQGGTGPVMGPDKLSLFFGAVSTGPSFSAQTSPQIVRLLQGPGAPVTWTATSTQPWLSVTPTSGVGPASLTVSVLATPGVPAVGASLGFIDYTQIGAGNPPFRTAVTLTTMSAAATSGPVGFVDTPADGRTGVTGAVPFTGWAVDDVEVVSVALCRQQAIGETVSANPVCGGVAEVFLGWATFIDGARPDVASLYPQSPLNTRAGWGFMLLTNMLPGNGNGTFAFSVWAQDREGRSSLLGTRTMTCNNAQATLPFGAIDTPLQGGLASGTAFVNFGWALTPQPKTIPADGSTITVLVDGVAVGNASYNHFRSDIAGLFPGRNNSTGAVGFRILDTSGLTDGLHTISWIVTDDHGATEGVGSRFFTVANGTALAAATVPDGAIAAPLVRTPLFVRRGWDLQAPMRALEPGASGRTVIRSEEVNRVELRLRPDLDAMVPGGSDVRYAGYLRAGGSMAALPIGAHLDDVTGVFTWAPGVGFVGTYDFVFVRHTGPRAIARHEVRIVLQPKGSGTIGPQIVVDTPLWQQDVAQPFALKGWAADLDAAVGTGISALHVWAYPLAGGPPLFLGSAVYGSARPDVVVAHGDQFADSGFSLFVQGLPHGNYDLAVFAWSEAVGDFLPARTVRATVR